MRLLIDMNLSPSWVGFFVANGVDAVHWKDVGAGSADDATLLAWARESGRLVFTHDLDFSALIALAGSDGPSILQVRTQAVLPEDIGAAVLLVLREHADSLAKGAIVSVDESLSRVRILPIHRQSS